MPKIMLHDEAARAALGRGVAKLAKAVRGTLGPRGMNAIMDRPIGTPIVSRDGVSIASEIELECPFENMGAQVLREVSKQTNEVAGDGTTTATVLADVLVQEGLKLLAAGANPVELVEGLELAVDRDHRGAEALGQEPRRVLPACGPSPASPPTTPRLARWSPKPSSAPAITASSRLNSATPSKRRWKSIEGMAFERGYLSHHMVTDVEKMQVVLDNPFILMTDHKIQTGRTAGRRVLAHRKERPAVADHRRGSGAAGDHAAAGAPGERQLQGRRDPSAGIRPLAQGDARGYRDHDRRPGDFGRSRRQARKGANCTISAPRVRCVSRPRRR